MLNILPGFPADVLAISASGVVTAKDYREVVVPVAIAKLNAHKHLNFYYCLGEEFSGLSPGAIWEDAKIGIAHWSGWGRIAIVTNVNWIADAARLFAPMFHHPVRVFSIAEEDAARNWIIDNKVQAA